MNRETTKNRPRRLITLNTDLQWKIVADFIWDNFNIDIPSDDLDMEKFAKYTVAKGNVDFRHFVGTLNQQRLYRLLSLCFDRAGISVLCDPTDESFEFVSLPEMDQKGIYEYFRYEAKKRQKYGKAPQPANTNTVNVNKVTTTQSQMETVSTEVEDTSEEEDVSS